MPSVASSKSLLKMQFLCPSLHLCSLCIPAMCLIRSEKYCCLRSSFYGLLLAQVFLCFIFIFFFLMPCFGSNQWYTDLFNHGRLEIAAVALRMTVLKQPWLCRLIFLKMETVHLSCKCKVDKTFSLIPGTFTHAKV